MAKGRVYNMKKIISSVLAMSMMLSASAFAAEIKSERDIANQTFKFTGTATANSPVTINVYAPGMDIADMFAQNNAPSDVVKFHDEIYADENGVVDFSIQLQGASGVHKTYVQADGDVKVFNLEYMNYSNNTAAFAGLASAQDIAAYINTGTNRSDLGFFLGLYDNVDQTKVAALMAEKLPAADPQEAIDIFNEAVITQALSEGDISGISAYEDKLAILHDGGRYERRYPLQKAGVDQRLAGKVYNTMGDFEAALAEAVVLETVNNPNGYQNVQGVFGEFMTELGLTSVTSVEGVYQQLSGNYYANTQGLIQAYNAAGGGTIIIIPQGGGNGGRPDKDVSTGNGLPFIPPVNPDTILKDHFDDMENAAWAKTAVNQLAKDGIISGKEEGKFYPADTVLREEFVTMIVRAFDLQKKVDTNEFADVPSTSWYYDYVMAAYQNYIVSGLDKTHFGAGYNITREDMAVLLYRVAEAQGIELKEVKEAVTFADEGKISDYAKDAVSALQRAGIVSGMENGGFAPKNSATRAQAAQMIYGLIMAK